MTGDLCCIAAAFQLYGGAEAVVSEDSVDSVLDELNPAVLHAVIETDIVKEMIEIGSAIADEADKRVWVVHEFDEEQQLIDIDSREIDGVATAFIGETNCAAVIEFRAIKF